MNSVQSIPVRVEGIKDEPYRTNNVGPILLQIEQALQDLQRNGTESIIDLGAMPFSARDEQELRARLGDGEVSATVEAFGPTLVQETTYPGVWLVEHQDADSRRLTLHIEVARVPSILMTSEADLADSLAALRRDNLSISDAPT
jgi:hydrogenase-1 operon protein HyaF